LDECLISITFKTVGALRIVSKAPVPCILSHFVANLTLLHVGPAQFDAC